MTAAQASQQRVLDTLKTLEAAPEMLQDHWCVPPQMGRMLYLLSLSLQAQYILEVGTSIGYSTLWLGLALLESEEHTDVRLDTLEASGTRLLEARKHFEAAGLTRFIHNHLGDALGTLSRFTTEGRTYDLMFIDARKSEYLGYFRLAETLVRPGGLLIADNTSSHRESMTDFIEAVGTSDHWDTADIQTANGFIIARKRTDRQERNQGA